jgi:hypothetical protein
MPRLEFSCPENILTHPKTEAGHFCQSCSKDVVDFRNFSATEMRNYFQNRPEKSCGIFHSRQMTDPLQTSISNIFRLAFGLVFLLGLSSTTLFGQQTIDTLKTALATKSTIKISGQITDENESIPFVKIAVYSANQFILGGFSDINGFYVLELPDSHANKDITIVFNFAGYLEHRIHLNTCTLSEITVHADLIVADEEPIIVGYYVPDRHNLIPTDPAEFNKIRINGDDIKHRQR